MLTKLSQTSSKILPKLPNACLEFLYEGFSPKS